MNTSIWGRALFVFGSGVILSVLALIMIMLLDISGGSSVFFATIESLAGIVMGISSAGFLITCLSPLWSL